jgi:nitrate reductase gamma subunit
MQTLYTIAVGPLLWVAFAVFVAGSIWRVGSMIATARKKEMSSVAYMSVGYSLRSILRWLVPFGSLGWKKNPGMTIATFLFHISLLFLILFSLGHTVMWDHNFGVRVWSLPENAANALTVAAVACCLYFFYRRLMNPAVRYATTAHDWAVLALVMLPLVSGFLAKWQVGDGLLMSLIHVLSGEAVLAALPFTRLSHALLSPFTRAYMGSEFGGVRHVPDW